MVNGTWQCSTLSPLVADGSGNINNYRVVEGPKPGRPTAVHVATQILTTGEITDYIITNTKLLDQFFSFVKIDQETLPKETNVWDWFKVARLIMCSSTNKGMDLIKYFANSNFHLGEALIDNIGKEHIFQLLIDMLNPQSSAIQWTDQISKDYFKLVDTIYLKIEKISKLEPGNYTYKQILEVTNLGELIKIISRLSTEVALRIRQHDDLARLLIEICFQSNNPHPMTRQLIELVNSLLENSKNLRDFKTNVDKPIPTWLIKNKNAIPTIKQLLMHPHFDVKKTSMGLFRLDLVRTCHLLVLVNYEQIHKLLYENAIPSVIFDLFFQYKNATVFHSLVFNFFEALIACDEGNYVVEWMKDFSLFKRLHEELEKPTSRELVPFLYMITQKIEGVSKMIPELGAYLSEYGKTNPLPKKPNQARNQKLGPPPLLSTNNKSTQNEKTNSTLDIPSPPLSPSIPKQGQKTTLPPLPVDEDK
eukprot:TRINITY_DN3167_c0_g1_i5.p1 TRINITY_DN3167_c0_g1~~TRINITY_DN3167_c0_g1_i5.p1  ORF type:complete len:549 (-),score=68.70 TRINITY_DN3167_c0_g1_i5:9-1436(-)